MERHGDGHMLAQDRLVEQHSERHEMQMDHYTIDLLARERISDLHREARQSRVARVRSERPEPVQHRNPLTGVRRLVARLAFAG